MFMSLLSAQPTIQPCSLFPAPPTLPCPQRNLVNVTTVCAILNINGDHCFPQRHLPHISKNPSTLWGEDHILTKTFSFSHIASPTMTNTAILFPLVTHDITNLYIHFTNIPFNHTNHTLHHTNHTLQQNNCWTCHIYIYTHVRVHTHTIQIQVYAFIDKSIDLILLTYFTTPPRYCQRPQEFQINFLSQCHINRTYI